MDGTVFHKPLTGSGRALRAGLLLLFSVPLVLLGEVAPVRGAADTGSASFGAGGTGVSGGSAGPSVSAQASGTGETVPAQIRGTLSREAVSAPTPAQEPPVPAPDTVLEASVPSEDLDRTIVTDALLREAEELLGVALPPARHEALRRYLAGASQGLLAPTRSGSGGGINREALRGLLAELGVLYTRASVVPYSLELRLAPAKAAPQKSAAGKAPTGANPDKAVSETLTPEAQARESAARLELARLELVSGLVQRAGSEPRLLLTLDKGRWRGELSGQGTVLRAESPSVDGVWRGLWGRYFRAASASVPLAPYTLRVWGWRDGTDVERLDQALRDWDGAVRRPALKGVQFGPEGATALWTLEARQTGELRDRLAGFTHSMGLQFSLESVPSPGTSSGVPPMPPPVAPPPVAPPPVAPPPVAPPPVAPPLSGQPSASSTGG